MTVHTAIALMAAAACVALGRLAAGRLIAREQVLDAWDGALLRMEAALTRTADGLPGILRSGAGEDVPALGTLADRIDAAPAADPEGLIRALPWDETLAEGERDILSRCLAALFSPDREAQAGAASYARERLSHIRRACREKRERDGKLYGRLGWLAGAALFILIC